MNFQTHFSNWVLLRARLLWLTLGIAAFATVNAIASLDERYSFSLPEQELVDSLDSFSEATGINIVASSRVVKGITAPAITGELSGREVLNRLIAETDLIF
ncbi:MAG: STN domain-containing protein [Verrucomicrobiota bacterium]